MHEQDEKEIQRLERLIEGESICVRRYTEAAQQAETEQTADWFLKRANAAQKRLDKLSAELDELLQKEVQ